MSRYVLYRRLRFGSPLFNSFLQNPTMALISSPVFSIFIFVFNTLRYVCDFLYESDNTFLSTYTTSFFIIAPHTRRMAPRCYIHFEKFDYMRHSFHNIWKNIIHYEYRGKSFIYVFFKKNQSREFPDFSCISSLPRLSYLAASARSRFQLYAAFSHKESP